MFCGLGSSDIVIVGGKKQRVVTNLYITKMTFVDSRSGREVSGSALSEDIAKVS